MFAYFFVLLLIAVGVAVGGALILLKRRSAYPEPCGDVLFRMYFSGGRLTVCEGRVPIDLRRAFTSIADLTGVTGEVRMHSNNQLSFSPTVGRASKEKFINTHMLSQTRRISNTR